jgi:FtsZ-interacting cell division protein YlmF
VSFLSQLKDIVGLNDQDEYDYEYDNVDQDSHKYSDYASHVSTSPAEFSTPRSEATRVKGGNIIEVPGISPGTSEMVLTPLRPSRSVTPGNP